MSDQPLKQILLVEDDELVLSALKAVLAEEPVESWFARNGIVAMAILEEQPIDLIVTDIIMPEMDGLELILAARKRWPDIKILAISGGNPRNPMDYLAEAKDFGAERTLAKPFEIEAFRDICRELLSTEGC